MECIFCKIINKEIQSYPVWEDKDFLVFLDIMPINKGHILIIPKKHEDSIYKLEDYLYKESFLVAKKLSESLRKATNAIKIGIAVEGFGVDHAHVHLVPLYGAHELNPERAQKASPEELKEMQQKLVKEFENIK